MSPFLSRLLLTRAQSRGGGFDGGGGLRCRCRSGDRDDDRRVAAFPFAPELRGDAFFFLGGVFVA